MTIDEVIAKLRARSVELLPRNWREGRKCPECDADATRPKCMWDMGPSCPRLDPTNYEPSPYVNQPDELCSTAADLLEKLK